MSAGKLRKASSILFVTIVAGNACNYLFQFFMSRQLSTADYGSVNSLLACFMIISVPVGTIMLVMAKQVSQFKVKGEYATIGHLYFATLKTFVLATGLSLLLFSFLSHRISDFLKISSAIPVIMLGLALSASFILPINLGILQGVQNFFYLGLGFGLTGVLRLAFGVILISLGFRINGALAAVFLSILVTIIITFLPIKGVVLKAQGGRNLVSAKEIVSYGFSVMIANLFFMMLTYVDMILVKHYFLPEEAGLYATAEVLGKIVLYLPVSIVLALFPLVAESHALNQDSFHLLDKGLLYTALISAATACAFFLFPEQSISILFGTKYLAAAPLLRLFSLAMVPLALINIIMYFNLARDRTRFIYSFIVFSMLEIILIALFHRTLSQVIGILIGILSVLFILNLSLVFLDRRQVRG